MRASTADTERSYPLVDEVAAIAETEDPDPRQVVLLLLGRLSGLGSRVRRAAGRPAVPAHVGADRPPRVPPSTATGRASTALELDVPMSSPRNSWYTQTFQKSVSETHFRKPFWGPYSQLRWLSRAFYRSAGCQGRGEMPASSATVAAGG